MSAPKPKSTTPRAVYMRSYRTLARPGGGSSSAPCDFCGAPDARQPDHAAGCPTLADLSRDELIAIARNCERGWREEPQDAFERRGREWRDKTGIAMRARGADA